MWKSWSRVVERLSRVLVVGVFVSITQGGWVPHRNCPDGGEWLTSSLAGGATDDESQSLHLTHRQFHYTSAVLVDLMTKQGNEMFNL